MSSVATMIQEDYRKGQQTGRYVLPGTFAFGDALTGCRRLAFQRAVSPHVNSVVEILGDAPEVCEGAKKVVGYAVHEFRVAYPDPESGETLKAIFRVEEATR